METESKKKRTYTVPVLLVLLTFSLIGNVLLYTLKLQNTQDDRQAKGEAIIHSGLGAKAHVQEVLPALDKLAASGSAEERAAILYGLGHSFTGAEHVVAFILAAEEHAVPRQPKEDRAASVSLDAIGSALAAVGVYSGTLSSKDSEYVNKVKALYTALNEQLADFSLDPNDKMVAMAAQTGGAWVDSGLKLRKAIEQSSAELDGLQPK